MSKRIRIGTCCITAIGLLVLSTGCYGPRVVERETVLVPVPTREPGPPPWAPARGHRAKHRYHYYPSSLVYFDMERNHYFYPYKGKWQTSKKLPHGISINRNDYVVIELDSDKPYVHHSEIVKKYPPGQQKKQAPKQQHKKKKTSKKNHR